MAENRAILNGEEPSEDSVNRVDDVPRGFKEWVKDNHERIESAKTQPYFIRDNKERVEKIFKEKDKKGELASIVDKIKAEDKIDYLPVLKLQEELSTEQIITRLGGGDRTNGSCSSLAFAYAANKGGLDVLDFRGGKSRGFFGTDENIGAIMQKVGGYFGWGEKSGIELLKEYTEIGKEYYLGIGQHTAIVRKVADKKFEYLELQSDTKNGWHTLDTHVLKCRFGASGRQSWGEMVEISKLFNDAAYRELMGYINTNAAKQLKGKGGGIK